jgi:hypothetical protein
VLYVKSLGVGLLAAVAGLAVQAVMFARPQVHFEGSSWDAYSPMRVYLAPLLVLLVMGTVIAWSRLRRKSVRS